MELGGEALASDAHTDVVLHEGQTELLRELIEGRVTVTQPVLWCQVKRWIGGGRRQFAGDRDGRGLVRRSKRVQDVVEEEIRAPRYGRRRAGRAPAIAAVAAAA